MIAERYSHVSKYLRPIMYAKLGDYFCTFTYNKKMHIWECEAYDEEYDEDEREYYYYDNYASFTMAGFRKIRAEFKELLLDLSEHYNDMNISSR